MPDEMKTPMKTPMTSFSKGGDGGQNASGVAEVADVNLEQRVADLEMRPRMPASGTGIDGDVLELDGVSPRWSAGGGGTIDPGNSEGDMLVWDVSEVKWVPYTGALNIIRWWDSSTNTWKEIEIPEDNGLVLQTIETGNLDFSLLKWR
jgi:hypothetical protein